MKIKNYMNIDASDKANETTAERIVRNMNKEAEEGLKHAHSIKKRIHHHNKQG